jgi:leader peptidase (prepilin peptidase)/N-methyltransferase
MAWLPFIPVVIWCGAVFVLGLAVGSFLNVLIARLPFEKSIVWPSSRCFACFTPIRPLDNVPILGYLRLRGKCRQCGAPFSSRYLWVEIGTGLAFLGLFVVEVLLNIYKIPALNFGILAGNNALPPWQGLVLFFYHAFLLSALIAAAVIDAEHRIIPLLIPFTAVAVGIVGGALMPWPWPHPAAAVNAIPPGDPWTLPEHWGKIPLGVQPWPFWEATFRFAPPGSVRLGLLNGVIGALAGSLVGRVIRFLFGAGFGREALGLGDADLLMMAGAFLGWQIAVLSLFVGALVALLMKVAAILLLDEAPPDPNAPPVGGIPEDSRELPFGPGLAVGVVVTWFTWRWLGPAVQYVFFDWIAFGLALFVMSVGVLAAGLLLRRPEEAEVPATGA